MRGSGAQFARGTRSFPLHIVLLLHARGHKSGSFLPPVGQRHKLAPCKRPALSECTPYRSRPNASAAVRTLRPFPNDTSVCFRSRFTYGMYTYFFRTRLPPRALSRLAGILSQDSVKSAMSARSARSAKSASTTASNISARLAKAAGAGGAGSGVPSPRATATGRVRGGSPRAGVGASRPAVSTAAARDAAAARDKELRSMKSPRAGTRAMGGRAGWL